MCPEWLLVLPKNASRCRQQEQAKKKEEIKVLEAQKQKLLHPVTMRSVMEKAKAAGLTAEEIAEKLGLEM